MADITVAVRCDTSAIERAVEWACENVGTIDAERLYDLVTDEGIEMGEGKQTEGSVLFTLTFAPEVAQAFKDAGYDG